MQKLLTIFYQVDEKSVPNSEIYAEALKRLNNLAEYRRLRIFAGNDTVPPVVWLVLLVGSVISISYTYFFGMKNIRAQYLIAAIAYGNDHDDFIFDLCSRSSLYRDEQGERAAVERRDGHNAKGLNVPFRLQRSTEMF